MSSSFTLSSVGKGLGREKKNTGEWAIKMNIYRQLNSKTCCRSNEPSRLMISRASPEALAQQLRLGFPWADGNTCYPKSSPAWEPVPADTGAAGDRLMRLPDLPPAAYLQGHPHDTHRSAQFRRQAALSVPRALAFSTLTAAGRSDPTKTLPANDLPQLSSLVRMAIVRRSRHHTYDFWPGQTLLFGH